MNVGHKTMKMLQSDSYTIKAIKKLELFIVTLVTHLHYLYFLQTSTMQNFVVSGQREIAQWKQGRSSKWLVMTVIVFKQHTKRNSQIIRSDGIHNYQESHETLLCQNRIPNKTWLLERKPCLMFLRCRSFKTKMGSYRVIFNYQNYNLKCNPGWKYDLHILL